MGAFLWIGFKWLMTGISFCLLRLRYKFLGLLNYTEFSFTCKATVSFSSSPLHGVKLLRICYKFFHVLLQFVCAYNTDTSTTAICDEETRNVISFFSVHFIQDSHGIKSACQPSNFLLNCGYLYYRECMRCEFIATVKI
jgi:hypothetical protein